MGARSMRRYFARAPPPRQRPLSAARHDRVRDSQSEQVQLRLLPLDASSAQFCIALATALVPSSEQQKRPPRRGAALDFCAAVRATIDITRRRRRAAEPPPQLRSQAAREVATRLL